MLSPRTLNSWVAPAAGVVFLATGVLSTGQTKSVYETSVFPIIKAKCTSCHQGKSPAGGLDFSALVKEPQALKASGTWSRAKLRIESNTMPPEGSPPLSAAQRKVVLDWLNKQFAEADCGPSDPGRVTMRRLNRVEFRNSIRDLLDITADVSEDFPGDDVGYGFDNIGDVLTTSPLLMEKVLDAVERATALAIHVPEARSTRYGLGQLVPERDAAEVGNVIGMYTNNEASVTHDFKSKGTYRLRVEAFSTPAGPEPANLRILVDRKPVANFQVRATADSPQPYEIPIDLDPGKKRVTVAFTNDYYEPNNPDPKQRDRNLYIRFLEVWSPPIEPSSLPTFHQKFIPNAIVAQRRTETAKRILMNFATRAFRRPPTVEEMNRVMKAFEMAMQDSEPVEKGIQLGIQAILVSPSFLFRVEPEAPNRADRPLNGYELATRLSYFLWSTTPDDRLMSLAGSGNLTKPDFLAAEVDRMLSSPKAAEFTENFAGQWLQLRKLATLTRDPKQFPDFTPQLQADMATETKLFFKAILDQNRPAADLIAAPFTMANERIAKLYGLPNVAGTEFRKVELKGTPRAGLLGQASILTVTSNPTRTSPVKRGKWVLEEIFGTPPPPPPPGADNLPENQAVKGKTIRERLEMHRKDPACSNCHKQMDSLGFALENFDPIGRYRTDDDGLKIDAKGVLPGNVTFDGPAELRAILLKNPERFARTVTTRLMTYALGRGLTAADDCAIDLILKPNKTSSFRIQDLIKGVVLSEPFRNKRGELKK
ncbi:MAG TPA: DUF1592 domain-containing protein [Fimbriimonadaceae bacterium]|nr:DUF1592 domain-containing protein [Fimbriimonadaceae bacterium]